MLATGGTIASVESSEGLVPKLSVQEMLNFMPHLQGTCELHGELIMNIDSTNMTSDHWVIIAQSIFNKYDLYDGFVITHGTDTMGYTSSALTYMLENLNKPVIVTGSQYPMMHKHSDAVQNINDAIMFALEDLKGVMVVFDGRLIAGTRAKKMKTRSYDAFVSINYPYLAEIKYNKIVYSMQDNSFIKTQNEVAKLNIITQIENRILVFKLFPGMHPDILDGLAQHYKGVVIESFGIGGIPNGQIKMAEKLIELLNKGIHVAITTQCLEEGVDLSIYEVGRLLSEQLIIYTSDMNIEAIVAKMMVGMTRFPELSALKNYIEKPIQGDIEYE